jgi:hypothetical protein
MGDCQGPGGSFRYLKLVSFVVCVILVAGCGSGAVTSPDNKGGSRQTGQGGGGQGGGGQGSGGQGGETKKYSWDLPAGDTSPTGNEGSLYGALMSCQGAEQTIAEAWSGFNSPRNVLMYMAAAHLCHGDVSGGRPFYNRAVSEYGLAGLWADTRPCDTYRSVASVLLQAPRESFACPEGQSPEWKSGPGGQDNPLTFDVDESQQSNSTSGETMTSQVDESQQSDSTPEETTTSQAEGAG